MKKIKNLLLVALFFTVATVLGQTKITGKVIDEYNEPLPGASIVIKGTSNGTTTDFNGVFELASKENEGIIVVSYIGYVKQEIEFSKTNSKLATITLKEDSNTLEEIMVFSSVAVDRKTPVAVSTIKQEEIAQKLGNQEFIEILKSTPGVFTTRGSGCFGDG